MRRREAADSGAGSHSSRSCRCDRVRPSAAPTTTVRHGTTSLFAALDVKPPARVIGECHRRHRVSRVPEVPRHDRQPRCRQDLDVHLILDNYGTHKTPLIRRWLAKRPALPSFTSRPRAPPGSTSSSAGSPDLTHKQIRRGAHRSTAELERAIREYISHRTDDAPKPFVWTKTADQILATVAALLSANLRLRTLAGRALRAAIA